MWGPERILQAEGTASAKDLGWEVAGELVKRTEVSGAE